MSRNRSLFCCCLVTLALLPVIVCWPRVEEPRFHDDADLNAKLVGKSVDEVRASLGDPFSVTEQPENTQFPLVWRYPGIYANPLTGKQTVLLVCFHDDAVISLAYYDLY